MFNLVVLTGRLTADPELRYTANNTPVTSFSIAVNRRYKAGEESQADFINIVAWRQTAEFVTKYFSKGSMIGIEGSIQTRRYVDKDGKNRTAFEVIANNVQFVESKRDGNNTATGEAAPSFSNAGSNEFVEIENASDDDLPF
ncbi:MAG: single-stranded DNA-binding protein [Clostridiales bacterium]|nr:single-stranded DNA-binding protein [Candidatus Equinaster intestinalis]